MKAGIAGALALVLISTSAMSSDTEVAASACKADSSLEELGVAARLIENAQTLIEEREFGDAISSLDAAISLRERLLGEGHPDTLEAMERLARLYRSLERFAPAETLFLRALAIREREFGPEHLDTISLINRLAGLYRDNARYEQAETLYLRALEARERLLGSDHRHTLAVRFNLAGLYQLQGRYSEAEPMVLGLLEADERLRGPDHRNTISSLNAVGRLYMLQGQYRKAEPFLLRARDGYERSVGSDDRRTLMVLNDLGLLYRRQARFGEAEPLYLRVLSAREESLGSEHPQTLEVLNNLAVLYKEQGRFEESEALFERMLASQRRLSGEEHPTTLIAMANLAGVYREMDQLEKAASLYSDTLSLQENVFGEDHPNTLVTLADFAEVLRASGKLVEAETLFARGVATSEAVFGKMHPQTLNITHDLAKLYELQGRLSEAEALHWRVLSARMVVLTEHHPGLADSYSAIGHAILERENFPSKAVLFFKKAVNSLQGVRQNMADLDRETQRSFLDKHQANYLTLQELLVDLGRFGEAELVGRLLKDVEYTAFVRGAGAAEPGEELALSEQERAWQAQLSEWVETPNRLAMERSTLVEKRREGPLSALEEQQLADLNAAHGDAYEAFFGLIAAWTAEVQAFDSEEVANETRALALEESRMASRLLQNIGPDVALLQAVAFEESLHLFFITGETFVHQEVPVSRRDLFNTIFDAREVIDQARIYEFPDVEERNQELREPLGQLHDWLVAPIEDELRAANTKTLMLNLQGQIRYLPFAALWDGQTYLTERYELALYTPAANTRYDEPGPISSAQGFGLSLAIEGFSPLPSVPKELEYVIGSENEPGILPGQYFLDDGFSRASFEDVMLSPPSVLHIATHFKLMPGDEASSYLVLGDGNRISIAAMNRSFRYDFNGVELLTLSACETALGSDGTGMELEGFGALAQNKGASSVVATLWQVSDDATPDMMRNFYQGLLRDDLSKAGAIREAQMQMITSQDYAEPYFWAPFVIMGNWR